MFSPQLVLLVPCCWNAQSNSFVLGGTLVVHEPIIRNFENMFCIRNLYSVNSVVGLLRTNSLILTEAKLSLNMSMENNFCYRFTVATGVKHILVPI